MVPKPGLPAHSCHPSLASFASITSLASFTPSPKAIHRLLIPLLILAGIVIASAAQTEVAHHITADLDYNQPYFTFLLTHITFSLVFPLHLAVLYLFRKQTIATYLDGIRHVIAAQVGGHGHSGWKEIGLKWSMKVGWLTLLISVPALSWFVAMVFTSAMDVTAIYATSSFHAYFFSMILLKTPLSRKTVASIVLAFTGVIVISFAGSGGATEDRSGPRNRALGDTVMMFGEYSSYDSIRCPR